MAKFLKTIERSIRRLVPKHLHKYGRASRTELILERAAPIDLIVHVGAHYAEDADVYEALGAKAILWVEADPETFAKLEEVLSNRTGPTRHITHCALVSEEAGQELDFHVFNLDAASSSVYRSTPEYRERFKDSHETGEVRTLRTETLGNILKTYGIDPTAAAKSLLVLDVQGHELSVLHGVGDLLKAFTFCKSEVSRIPMYEGGAQFPELDDWFKSHGFALVSHVYALVPRHGDVLFSNGGVRR